MYFTSNDRSQNVDKKKHKGIDYVISRKSKGVYSSKLKSLYTNFIHSIKRSGYRMKIKFDKDPLAVELNNYTTKNYERLYCP